MLSRINQLRKEVEELKLNPSQKYLADIEERERQIKMLEKELAKQSSPSIKEVTIVPNAPKKVPREIDTKDVVPMKIDMDKEDTPLTQPDQESEVEDSDSSDDEEYESELKKRKSEAPVVKRIKQKRRKIIEDSEDEEEESDNTVDDEELEAARKKVKEYHEENKKHAAEMKGFLVDDDNNPYEEEFVSETNNEIEKREHELDEEAKVEQQEVMEMMFDVVSHCNESKKLSWTPKKADKLYQINLSNKILKKIDKKTKCESMSLRKKLKRGMLIRCDKVNKNDKDGIISMKFKLIIKSTIAKTIKPKMIDYINSLNITVDIDVMSGCLFTTTVSRVSNTPPKQKRIDIFSMMKKVKDQEEAEFLAKLLKREDL